MGPETARRLTGRWSDARPAVLAVCCIAQFMVVLDVSIVNVALPAMRRDLDLSVAGQQWVVNAYTLTFAGLLMLGGRAADLFGRRRVFLLGLAMFTAFSLIGGVAQDGGWLVAARALQGVGGAVLAPATLSLLTTTFTDPLERRRALGLWSATAASGAAVGVLAGGLLTNYLGWRWVLFVNVPIGAAVLAASWFVLTESRTGGTLRHLDLAGAFSVTAGLSALVYGVVGTDTRSWSSPWTIGSLAAGAVLLGLFVLVEARFAERPLVPLGVFRLRSLSVANGLAMTVGASLFGLFFFLTLYLQQVNGYSPLKGGLAFLPAGLATMVGSLTAVRLVGALGIRRQLLLGPALGAAGLLWLSALQPGDGYLSHVLVPLVLVGTGLGWSFVPMTLAATNGIPPQQAGLASGLINTTRQVGGAVGLAAMATIASGAARGAMRHGSALAALTSGYDRSFLVAGALLALGAGLAGGLLPRVAGAHAGVPATERVNGRDAVAPAGELASAEASL